MTEDSDGISLAIDMQNAKVGNFTAKITLSSQANNTQSSMFNFQVTVLSTNTPPRFVRDISDLLYSRLVQSPDIYRITLGPTTDDEGHTVLPVFDDDGNSFITFNEKKMAIYVNSSQAEPSNYTVRLNLVEFEGRKQLQVVPFQFSIQIFSQAQVR